MSNLASSVEAGKSMIGEVLKNGKALEKFYAMICAQGVDENVAETLCFGDMTTVLPQAKHKVQINSHQSGKRLESKFSKYTAKFLVSLNIS